MKSIKFSRFMTVALATCIATGMQTSSAETDSSGDMAEARKQMATSRADFEQQLNPDSLDTTGETLSGQSDGFISQSLGEVDGLVDPRSPDGSAVGAGAMANFNQQQANFEQQEPDSVASRQQMSLDADKTGLTDEDRLAEGTLSSSGSQSFDPDTLMEDAAAESEERDANTNQNDTGGVMDEYASSVAKMMDKKLYVDINQQNCTFLMCMIDPEWPEIPDCVYANSAVTARLIAYPGTLPVCIPVDALNPLMADAIEGALEPVLSDVPVLTDVMYKAVDRIKGEQAAESTTGSSGLGTGGAASTGSATTGTGTSRRR